MLAGPQRSCAVVPVAPTRRSGAATRSAPTGSQLHKPTHAWSRFCSIAPGSCALPRADGYALVLAPGFRASAGSEMQRLGDFRLPPFFNYPPCFTYMLKYPDPDRPRNDKATILGNTIQMLKDLTSQVNKLKDEYTSLSEEARELTQEKNELRDEKASLKSEVDNLANQYQQQMRVVYPWAGMEPSIVIGPPPAYPYPVPLAIPSGDVTMHPQLQAYPFLRSQTSGTIPNACTPYMAYMHPYHPPTDQPSNNQPNSPVANSSSRQSNSPARDCTSKPSTLQQASCGVRSSDFGDVATDLELKTPCSSGSSHSETANKDSSSDLKTKQCLKQINCSSITEGTSSSRCSSSGPPNVSNSDG